ncbi:MAG: 1-deoxy-D-xylulose-5-phosphate synthase [Candidatus Eisenbacteria sp.]|nr:1-deoxy-D-xylulose-5-phosphate synthase [Candidatus Eisenbacteria bacterium]
MDGSILPGISSPADLKNLSIPELDVLAGEIREYMISVVSKNGGHLAPSLGTVELTLALHYCFDSPRDKIVWDVGHQAYVHKILTGRREEFSSLRQEDGISGFPRRSESNHDVFGTGHASTSISSALGIAAARDLKGEKHHVLAVIGDGALTGGMAFEGLNHAGDLGKDLIVILNDNRMSISPNVGAISRYLTRLVTARIYIHLEADVWELLSRMGRIGRKGRVLVRRIKQGLKNLVVPNILFEEMGFRYFGPVEGHQIGELITTLDSVRNLRGPLLVHVLTQKGKGYRHAEEDASRFHGIGSFNKQTGTANDHSKHPSYTKVFGEALVSLAEDRPAVVAITAAMPDGTGLMPFQKRFPERFFDVGIAEQHAVTFAAGLAVGGRKPVVAIYSTFLQRAFDQIAHDICLQNLNVVFCLDRAGLVGEDGPTHHGCFDLGYLCQLPNMVVMAPKDENELRHMLRTALDYQGGPVAIRYPRSVGLGVAMDKIPVAVPVGEGELLRDGEDLGIVAIGSMVASAMDAAERLSARGIEAAVFNARFAKPLDGQAVLRIARRTGRILTVEENVVSGGFGSVVSTLLHEEKAEEVELRMLGLPDRFVAHGGRASLLKHAGLDVDGIEAAAVELLGRSAGAQESRGRWKQRSGAGSEA